MAKGDSQPLDGHRTHDVASCEVLVVPGDPAGCPHERCIAPDQNTPKATDGRMILQPMNVAESVSAARGMMKMGRVMRVTPGMRVVAVFLILPLGRIVAAGWDDGVILDDAGGVGDTSVLIPEASNPDGLIPETTNAPLETSPFSDPTEAGDPPSSDLVGTLTAPFEAAPPGTASWNCHPPCDPEAIDHCPAAHQHALWTFRSEALVLWRNAPSTRPIYSTLISGSTAVGPTALDASDLNSDVLAAPRLSFLRTDGAGRTFEATYLYAGNFFSARTLPFVPRGYTTSPPGIYGNTWQPINTASAKLVGQAQSVEFNLRRFIWPETCQFLMGFRWLQWNETLQMNDSFPDGSNFYQTRCFNNLWGGQIGLDTLLLGQTGLARVEGLVKAGAYYNAAGQASSFRYALANGFTYANQARADEPPACSFVGEVGLTAVVPISCNCDFRCGYVGLWLTNLAQPTRQLSNQTINQYTSVPGLDTSGAVILQGLSLGLESRW